MVLDEGTPVEVWQEYEARKRAIDAVLTHQITELHRQRDRDVQAAADALGCGVPVHALSAEQCAAQAQAIARWRGAEACNDNARTRRQRGTV